MTWRFLRLRQREEREKRDESELEGHALVVWSGGFEGVSPAED